MSSQVYLSTETDRVKRAKLNNVIQSLDCFVSCTTNDKTCQQYGIINYCGTLTKGQSISGTKRPMTTNVPISTTNGTWVGNVDESGNLIIKNTNEVACTTTCATINKSATYAAYTYCKISEIDCCELVSQTSDTRTYEECGYTVTCNTVVLCCRHTIRKILTPNSEYIICGWDTRQQNPLVMLYYNNTAGRWCSIYCDGQCGIKCHQFQVSGNKIIGCTCWWRYYNGDSYSLEVGKFDVDNECINVYGINYVKCFSDRLSSVSNAASGYCQSDDKKNYSSVEMVVNTTFCTTTCTFVKPLGEVSINMRYM